MSVQTEIEVLQEKDTFLRATVWREYVKDGRLVKPLFGFKDFKTREDAEKYLAEYIGKTGKFKGGSAEGVEYRFMTSINLVHLVPCASFLYKLNW